MWKNNTSSLSTFASTMALVLAISTSSTTMTSDIYRGEGKSLSIANTTIKNSESDWLNPNYSIGTFISGALQNNLKKIDAISNLKTNWNGNGANAFKTELIDKIRRIISALYIQPDIFPTPADSIQLEYDGPDDSYLEIEIRGMETAEVYRINRDKTEDFFGVSSTADSLNKLVIAFYDGCF